MTEMMMMTMMMTREDEDSVEEGSRGEQSG